VNFRGEKRSNTTHQSTTDPESRLARKKGKESKLSYSQHVLMENRNGLVVDVRIDEAMGKAEVTNALQMISELPDRLGRRTIAGDKALRHTGIRALDSSHERHPARGQERVPRKIVGAGRSNNKARRLRGEPTHPQARRRDLRVDEDSRELQTDSVQGPGPHQHGQLLCRRGLQPAPNGPPDGETSVMIEVNGDGATRLADLDLVPPGLTAALTRPESNFSAPC
jgi:hypothetical protein